MLIITRASLSTLAPPPTLCKYSNGTANGAPLFDSILLAVKVAQPREREREENPSSPDPSNAENYGLKQSPNNNKPGFLPFSPSSRVTLFPRVLFLSVSPILSWWSLTSPQNLHEIGRRPVFADLKLRR